MQHETSKQGEAKRSHTVEEELVKSQEVSQIHPFIRLVTAVKVFP